MIKLRIRSRNRKFSASTIVRYQSTSGHESKQKFSRRGIALTIASSGSILASSIYTRHWRESLVKDVPLAAQSGAFFAGNMNTRLQHPENDTINLTRDIHELDSIIERTGLMGKSSSKRVKEELICISKWHQEHGFRGGVVLRELTSPLFESAFVMEGGDDVEPIIQIDQLSQRECYYLYYEIKPNAHSMHQIFCRGTTLFADVKTCFASYFVYDDELGIHLHKGFRDHATRLVDDVEPLLGHKHNHRATVEVSGHSLGGAVAMIVAMKLKKRGYNVEKVTSIAGARFCSFHDLEKANALLPRDAIRIEDDLDCVPFFPPWACSTGDKLWFTNDTNRGLGEMKTSAKYIPRSVYLEKDSQLLWTDDVFMNLRLPEALRVQNVSHRIRSYRAKLSNLFGNLDEEEGKSNNSSERM